MTDRELLELAAKAAGVRVRWYISRLVRLDEDGLDDGPWNPLTDDGDALRLAVKLGLIIDPFEGREVSVIMPDTLRVRGANESFNGDPYAATRRAIVRAAAAIASQA